MTVDHISLHHTVRHETRTQAAIGSLLRTGSPRYHAAVELQQAGDQLREARAVGLATTTMRYRYDAAQAVWDALTIANWQVTA